MAWLWQHHDVAALVSGPLNGTFQLYNPLRRMATGQWPGRDFLFFHGYGTLLLHYPVFTVLGSNLAACVAAKRLLSVAAYLGAFLHCAKAWRLPWQLAMVAALGCVLVDAVLLRGSLFLPGNSLLGVRSWLPAVALPLGVLAARKGGWFSLAPGFHTLLGCLLGLALFTSIEQGIAATAAILATLVFLPFDTKATWLRRTGWPVFVLLVAAASYLLGILAVAGPAWKSSLRYFLIDIPDNQFWYFGGAPNEIPDHWSAWLGFPLLGSLVVTMVLVSMEIRRLVRGAGAADDRRVSISILALLLTGLLAQAANLGALSNYYEILWRNTGLVGMVWLMRWGSAQMDRGALWLAAVHARIPGALVWALALAPVLAGGMVLNRVATKDRREMQSDIRYGGLPLSRDYAREAAVWRQAAFAGAKVSSTYTSLIEDLTGRRFGGPDYIIHALGSQRSRYYENLKAFDPDFFLTLNPRLSAYEEWLQLRHWDLYRDLIARFQPVDVSPFHVFWRKTVGATHHQGQPLDVRREGGRWLTSPNPGSAASVFTVSIDYEAGNPAARVPVVGKLARYFARREVLAADGATVRYGIPAPLPPMESHWEFPIILRAGERAVISPEERMNWTGASIVWQRVEVRDESSDPAVLRALVARASE